MKHLVEYEREVDEDKLTAVVEKLTFRALALCRSKGTSAFINSFT